MTDAERLKAFWKRWDHTPDDKLEFTRLKTRMDQLFREIWDKYIRSYPQLRYRFALLSGSQYLSDSPAAAPTYNRTMLSDVIKKASTSYPLVEAIQFLLWTLEKNPFKPKCLEDICRQLTTVLDLSPNVPIRVVYADGSATLHPAGARELDEALIGDNLEWLGNYPEVSKFFQNALKIYLRKDATQYREMLDNLRFSLEQLLRAVVNNQKSLENQKEEFLRWVKARDAHSQIINMYHDLLFGRFAQYQNDAVKHKEDKYTPAEVGFVLYLTGTFLRFIQRINEQPTASLASTS